MAYFLKAYNINLSCSLAPVLLQPVAHPLVQNPRDLHPHTTGNVIEMPLRAPLLVSLLVIHLAPLDMRLLWVLHLPKLNPAQLPVKLPPPVLWVQWRPLIMIPNRDVQLSHLTHPPPLGPLVVLSQTTWIISLLQDMVRRIVCLY